MIVFLESTLGQHMAKKVTQYLNAPVGIRTRIGGLEGHYLNRWTTSAYY
jgi:hypothetical protein